MTPDTGKPDDLIAFLKERIDEDERYLKSNRRHLWTQRPLREVAAKRAIVALHRTEAAKHEVYPFSSWTGEPNPDEYEVTCAVCGWVSDDQTSACPTLRHLAAVYSDNPGYDPAWRLEA